MNLQATALVVLGVVVPVSTLGAAPTAPATNERSEVEIVTVLGSRDHLDSLTGSHEIIDAHVLEELHVMTTNEALRKATGVNVRDEEGFGLRPNIGVRGLNPTRSTKVLLLEDGIPLAYAPYGDNASYYHPPIDRFARIEVLKGAGVNLYGPQTLGGVINYITPTPPESFEGLARVTAGDRGYLNTHVLVGGAGLQVDVIDKRGDGARDDIDSKLQDYNLKYLLDVGSDHTLILRANRYDEDSNVTYSGITDAELERFGHRYNPFDNDTFETHRTGYSITHGWSPSADAIVTTNLYYAEFSRDWWRQSSTTTDTQCNAVSYVVNGVSSTFAQARAAGFRVDPDDCPSRQGRLRDYESYGLEPRLQLSHDLFGADNELTIGARAHFEEQKRRQVNSVFPIGSSGTVAERNDRDTEAYAAFVQNRFMLGHFEFTPGLRVESITNERENRLTGADGNVDTTEWLPSLGISYQPSTSVTVFAGIHKGFAPPRTEDLIDNTGVSTDVRSEESTNVELGVRSQLTSDVNLDVTLFRNDFDNQIAVGSIAGGSTPLAEGEAMYEGAELAMFASTDELFGWPWSPYLRVAYTFLPTADIESPFVRVDNGTIVPGAEDGNRLPYAPEHLVTTGVGASFAIGIDAHLEHVYVDDQYADFANTRNPPALGNGQLGRIDSYHVWNAAVNWRLSRLPITVFAAVKNLADEDYVVDRTRGIQTGLPRLVQAGVEVRF